MHTLRFLSQRRRPGSLLLEVLIGISVFVLFVGAVGLTLLNGQRSTQTSGDRVRATEYATRALEAARSIRDDNYASLTPGNYGVSFNSANGKWQLSSASSSVPTGTGYLTVLTLSYASAGTDQMNAVAKTSWNITPNRSQSVTLTTVLTNWAKKKVVGDWSLAVMSGSYTGGTGFNSIVASKDAVYVGANDGIYVFAARSSSVTYLNKLSTTYAVKAMALKGQYLYAITSESNAELKVFDVSSVPPTQVTYGGSPVSYNLLASGSVGRSIAVSGDYLFVGANGANDDFFSFNIANSTGITLLDSIQTLGGIVDVHVSGSSAYLASGNSAGEMRIVNISNPADLTLRPGNVSCTVEGCYNLPYSNNGATTVSKTGTATILGLSRNIAAGGYEMYVIPTPGNAIPASSPSPFPFEASGGLLEASADPMGCYAFLASDWKKWGFQAVKIYGNAMTRVFKWPDTGTIVGTPVSLTYEPARDRAYLLTDGAVYMFTPPKDTACR